MNRHDRLQFFLNNLKPNKKNGVYVVERKHAVKFVEAMLSKINDDISHYWDKADLIRNTAFILNKDGKRLIKLFDAKVEELRTQRKNLQDKVIYMVIYKYKNVKFGSYLIRGM